MLVWIGTERLNLKPSAFRDLFSCNVMSQDKLWQVDVIRLFHGLMFSWA